MMKQVKYYCHKNTSLDSKSVLFSISGTSTLVLRRSYIEAVTQGELDATGVVVLHLTKHHPIAVEHDMVDAAVKEIVACQFDIETVLEEVFTDTKREHWISAVNPDVRASITVGMHVKVGLQHPVAGQHNDIAQL